MDVSAKNMTFFASMEAGYTLLTLTTGFHYVSNGWESPDHLCGLENVASAAIDIGLGRKWVKCRFWPNCPFLNAEPEACRAAGCVFEWLSDCGLNANPARRNTDGANVMVNLVKAYYPTS